MLYREQTFAPRAFHSELQQQTNTVNTQKSPPWACDKGCAEACAERFSALKARRGVRRGAASLLYRNHAKITVFVNSKPIPYFFRATQELSGIKYTWTGYYRLPPSWKFGYFTFFQRYVFTVHEYRITVCYGRSQESSCWKQGTRFVRVMENLESHEISGILLPVTETRGKLKSLVTADVKARTEKYRDK